VPAVEIVYEYASILGESPFWDWRKQRLLWLDIVGRKMFVTDVARMVRSVDLPEMMTAVVPLADMRDRRLAVTLSNGFAIYDPVDNSVKRITEFGEIKDPARMNDGKCDDQGRFWAGSMDDPGKGTLYCLEQGKARKVVESLTMANGIAFDYKRERLYLIDTAMRSVYSFGFDPDEGRLSDKRVVIEIAEDLGAPDGMTIDASGTLWVAMWGGAAITRWDPSTGEMLERIPVPAKNVTSCTFGDADLRTLYITTAVYGLSSDERGRYPLTGSLFSVRTETPGTEGGYYTPLIG
jgi:sugar lactone lactonase YvrE